MKFRVLFLAAVALLATQSVSTQQVAAPTGPGATWTLAAAGDAIITRRLAQFDTDADPAFRQMTKIIRDADAAFLNLEISLFRLSEFKGWPEVENGGNWELGPPEAAADLKALGFDLFNRANNHTTDYGVAGMRMTSRLLDELGIVHAGTGETLGEASRPAYFETPKGRIALIGLATTFTPMSRAGASRPDMRGRPGLNALRIERKYQADAATLEALRAAATKFGGRSSSNSDASVRLFGATVEPGAENRIVETVNAADEARILREIRNATRQADYVIVTSHSHEPGNDSEVPPPWMVAFTKKCIDAGATTYIVHGPHQLRGIEIYKGRPLVGLTLHPVDLAQKAPRSQRGTPRLADPTTARKIIDRLAKQSAAFGTTIAYENGVGVWKQAAAKTPTTPQ